MEGLCGRKCLTCMLYEAVCEGCSSCEAAVCKSDCHNCFALCPKRQLSFVYLKGLGGGEFTLKSNMDINLPEHVPILPDHFQEKPGVEMPVIAVHGGSMFSRNGENINPVYLNNGYAKALNISGKTEAILQFYVKDRTIEGFWDNRKSIYQQLKKMNFKAIIAPNFSVYEDAPRLDHIQNIKRSTIVYNELIENGFNAIPDVSWYSRKDLDRWIEQINENNIKMISFSFQVVDVKLKASNLWKSYLLGFRYLCQNINKDTKIIIIGAASHRRTEEIFKAACNRKLIILNQSAFVQSRRGMLSEGRLQEEKLTKNEIFEKNILYFNKIYKELNEKYWEESMDA